MFEKVVKSSYFLGIHEEVWLLLETKKKKLFTFVVFWRNLTDIHFLITSGLII